MKTSYVTDAFSSLAGLATVAYNNPEFFREVKNQIYLDSETFFIDQNRPSATLEGLFINKNYMIGIVKSGLNALDEVSKPSQFLLSVLGPNWVDDFSLDVINSLLAESDSLSDYLYNPSEYLEISVVKVLNNYIINYLNYNIEAEIIEAVSTEIIDLISSSFKNDPIVGIDSDFYFRMINNNPQTKISKVRPDSIISLYNQVDLGEDYRGVKINLGYLTLDEYYNNIAYPNTSLQ